MGYRELPSLISAALGVETAVSDAQQNSPGTQYGFVICITTGVAGGGSVAVTVQTQDPVTGVWFTYADMGTITTNTTTRLWLGDSSIVGSTGITTSLVRPFPARWRVSAVNSAGTITVAMHAATF